MTHIYVIHENAAWLEPLAAALDRQALPGGTGFSIAASSICRGRRPRVPSTIG